MQRNWSSLFFISGSSSFSVIHANVNFKIKSKERIGFVVGVFYLYKSGWPCDLLPKRAGTWNAKFHPALHEGVDVRTDVLRPDDFLRTKISWMHSLPNFLTNGATLLALRARELRYQQMHSLVHPVRVSDFFEVRGGCTQASRRSVLVAEKERILRKFLSWTVLIRFFSLKFTDKNICTEAEVF